MYGTAALSPLSTGSQGKEPVKIVTIAPEIPRALDAIQEMTKRGVTVGLGHT